MLPLTEATEVRGCRWAACCLHQCKMFCRSAATDKHQNSVKILANENMSYHLLSIWKIIPLGLLQIKAECGQAAECVNQELAGIGTISLLQFPNTETTQREEESSKRKEKRGDEKGLKMGLAVLACDKRETSTRR